MKEIRIEYKSGGIFRRSVNAKIPEEYSEMSSAQFHALMALSRKECTEEMFIERFYGIKSRLWTQLDKFYVLKLTEMLKDLKEGNRVNFFYDEFITVDGKKYFAPSQLLSDMSLQQFMSIDHYYSWYIYSEKVDYLYKFMACAYLPNNDFFTMDFERSVSVFEKFVRGNRWLYEDSIINWMLIKNWLTSSYGYLFPAAEKPQPGEPKSMSKKNKPASWTSFFDALVGEDVANLDSYKHLSVMDVFRICNNRIKNSKKRK